MKATLLGPSETTKTMRVTAPSAVTTGVMYIINGMSVVAMADADNGDEVVVCYECDRVRATKAAPLAIAGGDVLYLVAGLTEINKTSQANTACGLALEAAASAATTVDFRLFPVKM